MIPRFEVAPEQLCGLVPLLRLCVAHEGDGRFREQRPLDIPVVAHAFDPADVLQHRHDGVLERLLSLVWVLIGNASVDTIEL